MILQLEAFSTKTADWYQQALDIRTEVFVHEQNVDKHLEFDGLDYESTHYLLLQDGEPVACARSRETKQGIKLERFAVRKEYRGKAYGALILRFVIEDVKPANKKIYLNSQDSAIGFYKKHGFKEVGDRFKEANIEHVRMEYSRN